MLALTLHHNLTARVQDKNGTAYLVRSIGSAVSDHIGVSRLSPDYLDTRSAPAVDSVHSSKGQCAHLCNCQMLAQSLERTGWSLTASMCVVQQCPLAQNTMVNSTSSSAPCNT